MKRLYVAACLTGFVWVAPHALTAQVSAPSVEWPADTVRYTLMPAGIPAGERSVWSEAPNVRHHRMSYRGAGLESRLELDSAGLPRRIETTGVLQTGLAWEERFERRGDTAIWSTPDERDTRAVAGPAYYVSPGYEAAFDLSLLAPSLLTRADRSLPLLPEGTARLEPLGRRTVEAEGRSREVRHFAVHGLDLAPEYVWLDEDGRLFADEVSIIAGWEPVFPELHAASREALIRHGRGLFGNLIPPARERPLVIQGARLFDAESRSTRQGMTIVVRGNRIAAVGPDGSVQVPAGAEVIDGTGRTVLPGLWDMHVHTTSDLDEEMEAPLYIAGGVTTVRDLGSATDVLASLRHRSDSAEAIAPRILPALIMYGPGGRVLGVSVDTPEEAREAIDRFAALGYVQVKLRQPSVRPELVPVIAERARRHGMRLSGHVLEGMTGREAIESGYDEIQHLLYVRVGAAGIRSLAADEEIGARMAAVRPGTDEWRDFVRLLLTHDVVVDPTLAVVEESVGERPPVWLARVLRQFPPQAGRMARYNAGPPAPPPMLRDHWDEIVANGPDMVRALHEAGVPLVAGTDADFGGFPLHRELEVYVEAGIPASEVLALATLGAAHVMGMDDELGSIEPGKLADLILVDGDPTTDISDIRRVVTVIKDGRVYNPAAIYRALGIEPCCEPESWSAAPAPDTVQVAPPTGDRETDRASILAALERVEQGGAVQFASGTYVVGRFIDVAVPRITLVGHPEGSTIRGCDPAAFDAMERDDAVVECNGFNLTGGYQTVRDLTFEHAWHTLALGDYTPGPSRAEAEQAPVESRPGGYVVERSTFRYTQNGIRLTGQWSEPAVIRDNRFIDTYHAVVINGMTAHVIDNDISVPEPERVPHDHRPGTPLYVGGWADVGMPACDGNVIAGNRIEGHPDGIVIAPFPGGVCRRNEIRDNTIRVARIRFTGPSTGIHVRSPSDSVLVGVPIALLNGVFGDGVIEDNRIEGNRVLGASGVAIELVEATGNRIANNTITGVVPRDPFPGNTLFPEPLKWSEANGSAIWMSPGSDGNEIVGNTFEDIAAHAVFLEGDDNRVELRSADDSVRDLGSGNEVTASDGGGEGSRSGPQPAGAAPEDGPGPTGLDPWPSDVPPGDTVRYTGIVNGMTDGERMMWREGPDTCDMARSCFPRTERLGLDDDGLPVRLEVSGQKAPWNPWEERFERQGSVAQWTTSVDEDEQPVEGPRFSAHPRRWSKGTRTCRAGRGSCARPTRPECRSSRARTSCPASASTGNSSSTSRRAFRPPKSLGLATIGAARVMGMDDELGSIEPGKLADLILVDGDPTTDIRDIRRVKTVIKDGRVYDPGAIYRELGIEPCCQE